MKILHIFDNYERLHRFIRQNISSCLDFNKKELSYKSPTGEIRFRVITNQEDFMQICGLEMSCVIWHYPPEQDIKQYVESKVRCMR